MKLCHEHVLRHRLLSKYDSFLSISSVLVLHHIHRVRIQDIGLLVKTCIGLDKAGEKIVFLAYAYGIRHVATGLDYLRLVKSLCP